MVIPNTYLIINQPGIPDSDEIIFFFAGLKKSAAGLCVGMGSFSDPDSLPGLAHFLEHMVFMGSEKYPDENGFDSFVNKNGGYDNASTDCETTVFYFEVQRRHFREGEFLNAGHT